MKTPFVYHVPTDVVANLKWRARVHRKVIEDSSFAKAMWDACAADPLFYICGFGYTYDSRMEPFTKLPFILYPFQRDALLEIFDAIGSHDLLVAKSRDMGASWLCVLAFEWMWHFAEPLAAPSFLMGSRVEDYVDKADNPKALFQKLDYFHGNLPPWLMPEGFNRAVHRRKMHLTNSANGAVIDGESSTGDFARGDRRTAILLDEFAAVEFGHSVLPATRDATRSRIFNSTPKGINNAYYDMHQTSIKKLRLHWMDHPEKRKGAYKTAQDGSLEVIDEENYPKDYEPILDGELRSIRFDIEEKRCGSKREMAQEWNIDFLGSGHQYFDSSSIQDVIRKCARPPIMIGDLEYDSSTAEPIRFREDPNGCIRLWCLLDKDGKISGTSEHLREMTRKFVLGADVSAGTGASNSCLAGYGAGSCEKILEYVNPYIRPEEFAKQAVAIARWLGNAYLVWESPGPGRQFGSRVTDLGYGNIYLEKREEAISGKVSQIPGWAPTREKKLTLIGAYRSAIEKEACTNRSKEAFEECLEYIFDTKGGVSHSREDDKVDPSGAKSNHGDRVIADALAWRGLSERRSTPKPPKPKAPIGSLAWRIEQRKVAKPKPGRQLQRSEGWRW